MEKAVYLKPNVVIEPLFERWYAWSHLISPATAAMNVVGRHLKIMNSYIQAPQAHAAAVRNPKMLGGPFVDYGGQHVEEIRALRDSTLVHNKWLMELAAALKQLDLLLKNKAKGYSLQALYDEVPEPLKGYVELVYDLNHHATFRIYESLLYTSPFYDTRSQTIALWLTNNDDRPFVLSTPRIDQPDILHLPVPFSSSAIDVLSKMKRIPGSFEHVKNVLGVPDKDLDIFRSFFSDEPPSPYNRYNGDRVRMRYFGHACILIETGEISILLDPVVSYYGYPQEIERFSDMDLPDSIDYVLITHNHQDHILLETLLTLRHKIKNIIIPRGGNGHLQDPSLKLMFGHLGFPKVTEVSEMENLSFADCSITGIPFVGEHADLNITTKICYQVKASGMSMLFMADSCNVQPRLYEHIQREIGKADVLFLGMECEGAPLSWLYGPLLSEEISRDKDDSRRLSGSDFAKGKSLVEIFEPSELYVYAMGQEPWLRFISSIRYTPESHPIVQSDRLIEFCRDRGIAAERLFGEKEILYPRKDKTDVARSPAAITAVDV